MKRKTFIGISFAAATAALATTYALWPRSLPPAYMPGKLPPDHLVGVVFDGPFDRTQAGLDLYFRNEIGGLIITGVPPDTTMEKIITAYKGKVTRSTQDIVLDYGAMNTDENARFLKQWLNTHPAYNQIVLVTSNFHMERSATYLKKLTSAPIYSRGVSDNGNTCDKIDERIKLTVADVTGVQSLPGRQIGSLIRRVVPVSACED